MVKKFLLLGVVAFVIAACSSTNTSVIKKSEKYNSQESYILSHTPLEGDKTEEELKIAQYFEKSFDAALQKAHIKTDALNYDTIIQYDTFFDEGNRALRYFVGFGAGAAVTQIKIMVVTRIDKESIIELTTEATMSIGVFGGDAKSILDNAANDIVKTLLQANVFKINK